MSLIGNILSFLALTLSLSGNFLIIYKKIIGFPVWILSNILWIVVNFIEVPNYSQIFMFLAYAGTSVYGWYQWNHEDK